MSAKESFILAHETARKRAMQAVVNAPQGFMVVVSEPAKKRIQEEKYHAMIGDIAKQCVFLGKRRSENAWKRLLAEGFVEILRSEAKGQGKPDPFPAGEMLPSLDGLRIVQVEVLTRDFTVKQAALFIEHLYAYGSEAGVTWSEPKAVEHA